MSDPMKMMNDFFQNRPKRTLLDSINEHFIRNKYEEATFSIYIEENENRFIVIAELPGVPRENINVEIIGNELIVQVREVSHHKGKIGGKHVVKLPSYVMKRKMKAVYENGILRVSFIKKKATKIEIE